MEWRLTVKMVMERGEHRGHSRAGEGWWAWLWPKVRAPLPNREGKAPLPNREGKHGEWNTDELKGSMGELTTGGV